jgi:hypothetical protein
MSRLRRGHVQASDFVNTGAMDVLTDRNECLNAHCLILLDATVFINVP